MFTTIKEFNKEYKKLRTEILERHGYKDGDKVRLKKGKKKRKETSRLSYE